MSERTFTVQASSNEAIYFSLHDFAPTSPQKTWLDGHFAHLSASSLGMFRRCPRQFQQRYLLGRKEPPGEGLVLGNFFHETMNHNHAQKVTTHEDRPLSEMLQYLNDAAIPKVVEAAGGLTEIRWDWDDAAKALEIARSDATRITSAYHARVLPRLQPVATEQRMEWWIEEPIPIIGYIDTILPDRAIDTKTGKQAPSKLKPGWQLQADLYSSYLGMPIEYQTLNRSAQPKIMTALESEDLLVRPNFHSAQNLIKVIHQLMRQIEWMYERYGLRDEWPTWGRWADWTQSISPCAYCGFRKDCPAWQ